MTERYVIEPTVLHEVFDDEVVVADLQRGTYYSVGGSGVLVWSALRDGVGLDRVVDALANVSGDDRDVIEESVQHLVDDLAGEGLIERATDSHGGNATNDAGIMAPPLSFEPPTFEKFTDMQQLLLLDPIHEVDDAGWPVPRQQP